MKLQDIQNAISSNEVFEPLTIFAIGHKLLGLDAIAFKEAKQIQEELLQYEREGKTGFDCGWVYVTSDDVELIDDITNFLQSIEGQDKYEAFDNIVPCQFYPYGWSEEPTAGFQVRLNKYPMHVQSTTIKSAVAKELLGRALPDFNFNVHVILD